MIPQPTDPPQTTITRLDFVIVIPGSSPSKSVEDIKFHMDCPE